MIRFLKDESEIVKLFPLIIADGENLGHDQKNLNPQKLWNTLYLCMTKGAIIVSGAQEFTGLMALFAVESYWSEEITLTNLIYYVAPEHRKSKDGLHLLLAAKEFAIAKNMTFDLHVESHEDLDRKDLFFKRYGFKRCGGSYQLRRNNA